jgi:hypothetical protein
MVSTQFAGLVQHATTTDGLVNVLVDNMVVYLHVIVNGMRFPTALFPIWSIDVFTTHGLLLVALLLVFRLLWCKFPPLTHFVNQCMPEDGKVVTGEFARVMDAAKYRLTSKLDAVLLDDTSFIIYVVHLDLGVGMSCMCKDIL